MYSISKNNHSEWCGQNVPAQEPLTAIAQTQEPARELTIVENGIYSTLTLSTANLQPVNYLVEGIIGTGLTILAGAPKGGKSCLCMALAHAVGNNELFLGQKVVSGSTLYCTFEDTLSRVKERVSQMKLTPSSKCYVTTQQRTLANGLIDFVCDFRREHPDMVLLILDTLQWVRDSTRKMSYANDVAELAVLKQLSQKLGISIIVVHHTRKGINDGNPLYKVSGTTGLTGTADTILVLDRNINNPKAKLSCVGKDIGAVELDLVFDAAALTYRLANNGESVDKALPEALTRFIGAIISAGGFTGDNSTFAAWLYEHVDPTISVLQMRQLLSANESILISLGIEVSSYRTAQTRGVRISYSGNVTC